MPNRGRSSCQRPRARSRVLWRVKSSSPAPGHGLVRTRAVAEFVDDALEPPLMLLPDRVHLVEHRARQMLLDLRANQITELLRIDRVDFTGRDVAEFLCPRI